VESFAKLQDSIFFWQAATATEPAVLYVNQWVGSNLDWGALGLKLSLQASHFGPGAPLGSGSGPRPPAPPPGPPALGQGFRLGWLRSQQPLRRPPAGHTMRASITVRGTASNQPAKFTLRLRIPAWTTTSTQAVLTSGDAQSDHTPTPGSYYDISR
jgi:hypothetical protein